MQRNDQPYYKPIRSFVRRAGRVTAKQQRAKDIYWSQFGIDLPENKGLLDFVKIFSREAPTVLEIGFGMGDSLLAMAQADSATNYLGIEVHVPGIGSVLAGIEERKLQNLRVIKEDAVDVLTNYIPDRSFDKAMIFFPDPWPKKRHHKRRLLQKNFIDLLVQKLKPQGLLHIATDWQPYMEHIMQVLQATANLDNIAGDKVFVEPKHWRVTTKFDNRAQRLGHQTWDMVCRKTGPNF